MTSEARPSGHYSSRSPRPRAWQLLGKGGLQVRSLARPQVLKRGCARPHPAPRPSWKQEGKGGSRPVGVTGGGIPCGAAFGLYG